VPNPFDGVACLIVELRVPDEPVTKLCATEDVAVLNFAARES
jgi:hypothetical protein